MTANFRDKLKLRDYIAFQSNSVTLQIHVYNIDIGMKFSNLFGTSLLVIQVVKAIRKTKVSQPEFNRNILYVSISKVRNVT